MEETQFIFYILAMRSVSFFFTGVFFIILLCYSLYTYTEISSIKVSDNLSLIPLKENKSVIRSIESHGKIHTNEDKIFFVESQNTVQHKLSGRQACSIESAGTHQFYYHSYTERKMNIFGHDKIRFFFFSVQKTF
jgi:hypothetical protein